MTDKVLIPPNTTLYPVPVVLVTCGNREENNLITLNRIASCNAEPPMISISVRPGRASHGLIEQYGEFVVNLPWPDMEVVCDFVGATTLRKIDKWAETGLKRLPANQVQPPLLADCPVNLECKVIQTVKLPSHSLFIAEVVALHADSQVVNARGEVDFDLVRGGLVYRSAIVRERPVDNFRPQQLRASVHQWRDNRPA